MFTPFELIIALVNITFRIVLFYIFWLPSVDVDVDYANRSFSFVNEKWAWSQKPFSNISLLTNATACPSNQVLLTGFVYHIQSTSSSLLARTIDNSIKLTQWGLANSDKSFILCGTTINTTFIQQASKNETCDQQNLNDCGNGNDIQFCVSQDSSCPITSFSIDETLTITNNIDSNQMPLALTRIDSYWPCLISNKTNVFPDYNTEMDIGIEFEKCDNLDTSYQSINNITDEQFYKINNESDLDTGQNFTKGLFYKQYPKWSPTCNGDIFKQALALIDQQNLFVYSSESIYLLVILYLLICNYAIPTIPFLLRCIESFSLRFMIRLDYLARIVLSILLVYYSVTAYLQSLELLNQIETVYDYHCLDNQSNLDNLYDATENHKDLNLAAILTFAFCWGIEFALLLGYGLQSLVVRMCRCWRQEKLRSQRKI